MALHGDQYLTCWVYLRLKCVIRCHISFNLSLNQFFILPLQKRLLSVPEICKLILSSTSRWASHINYRCFFVSWMWSSGAPIFRSLWSSSWRSWATSLCSRIACLLLCILLLLLNCMIVKSLVALNILLFLCRLCHYLSTFLIYRGLKFVFLFFSCACRWLFTACNLLLKLFDSLYVVGITIIFRRWRLRLLCFLKYSLAIFACFWLKLAFLLDLPLNLSFLEIYKLLFVLQMLTNTLIPRFESLAHLLWLATHRLRLESAPTLLNLLLFVLIREHFFTRNVSFRLVEVALVIYYFASASLTRLAFVLLVFCSVRAWWLSHAQLISMLVRVLAWINFCSFWWVRMINAGVSLLAVVVIITPKLVMLFGLAIFLLSMLLWTISPVV